MDRLGVYFSGVLVGFVALDDAGRFDFTYNDGWRARPGHFAISQSLPLDRTAAPAAAHAFFANL